jgi:hypothetical protein
MTRAETGPSQHEQSTCDGGPAATVGGVTSPRRGATTRRSHHSWAVSRSERFAIPPRLAVASPRRVWGRAASIGPCHAGEKEGMHSLAGGWSTLDRASGSFNAGEQTEGRTLRDSPPARMQIRRLRGLKCWMKERRPHVAPPPISPGNCRPVPQEVVDIRPGASGGFNAGERPEAARCGKLP